MKLGVLTTSWPSAKRPWSGHFIADLASGLAARGHDIVIVALRWHGDDLLDRPGVRLEPAEVGQGYAPMVGSPGRWPLGLGTLAASVRHLVDRETVDVWMGNWWPSALAAPARSPCVAVLHGSDVDIADRWASSFVQGLTGRLDGAIAVADHLAERFGRHTSVRSLGVCPLGAARATEDEVRRTRMPRTWVRSDRPRVLTVARDVPGKGLEVARTAAEAMDDVGWAIITPEDGFEPAGIRGLLRTADVLVVPSLKADGVGAEGRPHVIAQALVAGVPVVGGPNRAVRDAVCAAGQVEVTAEGPTALVEAVRRAVGLQRERLRESARRAGREVEWDAVLPGWESALRQVIVPAGARG